MSKEFDYWFDYMVRDLVFYVHEKRLKNGEIETKYFWEQTFFDIKSGTFRVYDIGFDDNGKRYISGSTLQHAKIVVDKNGKNSLAVVEGRKIWEFIIGEEDFDPRDERLYHLIYVRGEDTEWYMDLDYYRIKEEPYDYCI